MKSCFKYMWVLLLALIISGLFVSNSFAVHELFKSIDGNTDGKITKVEFSEDMKSFVFYEIDSSHNKSISKSEWMSIEGMRETEKHEELFQRIDKNKDNKITLFEFSNYADKHSNLDNAFIRLDKDENNSLSPDEITARPLFKMLTIKFK